MGTFDGYCQDRAAGTTVFDITRTWISRLSALRQLFAQSKMIRCVRNPSSILDSIAGLIRRNNFDLSRMFSTSAER